MYNVWKYSIKCLTGPHSTIVISYQSFTISKHYCSKIHPVILNFQERVVDSLTVYPANFDDFVLV